MGSLCSVTAGASVHSVNDDVEHGGQRQSSMRMRNAFYSEQEFLRQLTLLLP